MSYKEQIAQLAEKLGVEQTVVEEIGAIVESAIATGIQEREQELTEQIEKATQEANQLVAEQRVAIEAEVKAHAEEVARQFVAENKDRFVQTEKYDNMVQFVEQIKEAFAVAGIGTDNLEKVESLKEEIQELKTQLQEAKSDTETAQASSLLEKMIDENNLSMYQRERVLNLIKHTRPATLSEFKTIAEYIISEVKKDDEDDEDDDDDNEKPPKEKEPEDKGKKSVSERMHSYLQVAQA